MKFSCIVLMACALAPLATGQRRGGSVRPGPGAGTGRMRGPRMGSIAAGGPRQFNRSFGRGYRTGYWPSTGYFGGFGYMSGFGYPMGYGSAWASPPPPVYYPQPAVASPIVIVIGDPAPAQQPRHEPEFAVRADPPADPISPAEPYRPVTYDIRFKDGRTETALAFWVKDGKLHYVTKNFVRHAAALAAVDRGR